MRMISLVGVAAVAGCASVVTEQVRIVEPAEVEAKKVVIAKPGSGMHSRYGSWVGKGPRILSTDGKALPNAIVWFAGEDPLRILPMDSDGSVLINRYIVPEGMDSRGHRNSLYLYVACPGYHSRTSVQLLTREGVVPEIRLEPEVDQSACRTFKSDLVLPMTELTNSRGFDLIEGDWLPPYGWGKTEDLRVTISGADMGNKVFSVSNSGVEQTRGFNDAELFAKFEFVRKGDGFDNRSTNYEDCTNKSFVASSYRNTSGTFRARGYLGALDEIFVRKDRVSTWEQINGKTVEKELSSVLRIQLGGRVNPELGLKTLPTSSVKATPRKPVCRPVPEDGDRLAFGLSADGRAAVCFGWTKEGARIPDIFEKGVYSDNPVADLPRVETLYLESPRKNNGHSERVVSVRGLPELRTLVCLGYGWQKIEQRAFADNAKLTTVLFDYESRAECAGNAFEGCATNLTAVFASRARQGFNPWETIAVSNIFTKMVKVSAPEYGNGRFTMIMPEVDVQKGAVDLPVVHLGADALVKEYPDGRIQRYLQDGNMEKLRK